MFRLAIVALLWTSAYGCQPSATDEPPATAENPAASAGTDAPPAPIEIHPQRQALFGDLHVHTSWSTDAFAGGNRVGPRNAYRFARGEAIKLPNGIVTQLTTPLDFAAMTDHAEGFDMVAACTYPDHPQFETEACQSMRNPGPTSGNFFENVFRRGAARPAPRNPELCADVEQCLANARATWQRTQAVAEEFNEPGRFTALIGYEFSALLREFGMLHRNVIFRGTDVIPHALGSADVKNQADFFAQLDAACQTPCAVLTIPHNTNFSWGLMFSRTDEDGSAYSAEDLERRARLDRLAEVTQQKGNSECQTGVGTTDEDCNFGNLFEICAPDQFGRCARESSFVRNALLDGIQLASEGKTNPFKLGLIGSTDTHASDPGNTETRNRYAQAAGNRMAVQRIFDVVHPVVGPIRRTSEGGLAAVWADSNTRAAIFDALRRREAFATSGSRLRIRFFGGDLPPAIDESSDAIDIAYERGVPMGGDLSSSAQPRFWVWAAKDPSGTSLDRVQIIKGWIEAGEQKHRVWDVACSNDRVPDADGHCPPTSATVDTATCELLDSSGAAELQTTFIDPTFRVAERAFYYVRVLENPSCRWTTWLANSAGISPPEDVPVTVQNRGWSSPIWLQP